MSDPLGPREIFDVFAIIVGGVILAAVAADHAYGAPLGVWTGPGDRACAGRCSEEWARAQLPAHRQRQLERPGHTVEAVVRDGDLISLMTYWRGEPLAQTGVVAVLPMDEPATCRIMDGWSWCQVHGCENWAAVEHAVLPVALTEYGVRRSPSPHGMASGASLTPVPASFYGVARSSGHVPPETHPEPEIPPVPLPAPLWLLLSALGILIRLASSRSPSGARGAPPRILPDCRPVCA